MDPNPVIVTTDYKGDDDYIRVIFWLFLRSYIITITGCSFLRPTLPRANIEAEKGLNLDECRCIVREKP